MSAFGWLTTSGRWKHLLCGIAIAALMQTPVDGLLAAILAAAACEYKDRAWGGRFDWWDFAFTVAGGVGGAAARHYITTII